MSKPLELYQDVAEALYRLGWRPNCDAQHENLRDALPQLRAMLAPPVTDGGPAFPMQDPQSIHAFASAKVAEIPASETVKRDQVYSAARAEAVGGMSLRAYFAGQALQGILAGVQPSPAHYECCKLAAGAAVEHADALLKELAK